MVQKDVQICIGTGEKCARQSGGVEEQGGRRECGGPLQHCPWIDGDVFCLRSPV